MLHRCFVILLHLVAFSGITASPQAQLVVKRNTDLTEEKGINSGKLSCLIAHVVRPTKDNLSAGLVHLTVSLMTLSD